MTKNFRLLIHKIAHWEYWPFYIFNIPIFFVWTYYALKARTYFFFNAANPTIKNGGFLMESKKEVYDIIPEKYIPKTVLIVKGAGEETIKNAFEQSQISFPCIVKPDIGSKGRGVEKIQSIGEIIQYAEAIKMDFLIQEFIGLQNEVGIFYCRIPTAATGFISGIVSKEFVIIKGDGASSIEKLITATPRYLLQLDVLKNIYGEKLKEVLAKDDSINLIPFGNHARGSKFIDASHWADEEMTKMIDELCQQIPQFYYGRLDIRYDTLEKLRQGLDFKIIELNGSGSEPTHIYDPEHSIFFAWKEIARHFGLLYTISKTNCQKGIKYLSFGKAIEMFIEDKGTNMTLKKYKYLKK